MLIQQLLQWLHHHNNNDNMTLTLWNFFFAFNAARRQKTQKWNLVLFEQRFLYCRSESRWWEKLGKFDFALVWSFAVLPYAMLDDRQRRKSLCDRATLEWSHWQNHVNFVLIQSSHMSSCRKSFFSCARIEKIAMIEQAKSFIACEMQTVKIDSSKINLFSILRVWKARNILKLSTVFKISALCFEVFWRFVFAW